jgi:TPR repeat protein
MRRWSLILVLLVGGGVAVANAGFEEGNAAYSKKDYATAFRELQPLAEHGDYKSQLILAEMYENGYGVKEDHNETIKWYRLAAAKKCCASQVALGFKYQTGRGVPKDYSEAARWFQEAAEKGSPPAQIFLGSLYTDGLGVRQDLVQAYMWFNLAAAKGDKLGPGLMESVEKRMTREQIAEAQALAKQWRPRE